MEIRIAGSGPVTINTHGQNIELIQAAGNNSKKELVLHFAGEHVAIGMLSIVGNVRLGDETDTTITRTVRQ